MGWKYKAPCFDEVIFTKKMNNNLFIDENGIFMTEKKYYFGKNRLLLKKIKISPLKI